MKIEKISDNQIRCTLTREDLASRKINLHELAYGSEKAKLLFQDMMQEAFREYGFTVDNSPLMIEAIPLSGEAIVLIITRVDNPEELDSRFARFSREDGSSSFAGTPAESMSSLDDIVNLISRLTQGAKGKDEKAASAKGGASSDPAIRPLGSVSSTPKDTEKNASAGTASGTASGAENEAAAPSKKIDLTRFYLFRDLETVIRASGAVSAQYKGWNTLFKNPEDGNFYLILRMDDTPAQEFNRVCNVLTEYGVAVEYTGGMEEFFAEHMHTITAVNALQVLREL